MLDQSKHGALNPKMKAIAVFFKSTTLRRTGLFQTLRVPAKSRVSMSKYSTSEKVCQIYAYVQVYSTIYAEYIICLYIYIYI